VIILKVKVVHGPNLNLLGKREPDLYGSIELTEINNMIIDKADKLGIEVDIMQSNHEGDIIDFIQNDYQSYDGIIINPAGLTHYSIALRDVLTLTGIPIIEVHISNIFSREEFRSSSVISAIVEGIITGLGHQGYLYALDGILQYIKEEER
jgi:3-dehydroquinate dehydratase-2